MEEASESPGQGARQEPQEDEGYGEEEELRRGEAQQEGQEEGGGRGAGGGAWVEGKNFVVQMIWSIFFYQVRDLTITGDVWVDRERAAVRDIQENRISECEQR